MYVYLSLYMYVCMYVCIHIHIDIREVPGGAVRRGPDEEPGGLQLRALRQATISYYIILYYIILYYSIA